MEWTTWIPAAALVVTAAGLAVRWAWRVEAKVDRLGVGLGSLEQRLAHIEGLLAGRFQDVT